MLARRREQPAGSRCLLGRTIKQTPPYTKGSKNKKATHLGGFQSEKLGFTSARLPERQPLC